MLGCQSKTARRLHMLTILWSLKSCSFTGKLLAHTVCVYASSIIFNVKATEILRRGRYTKKNKDCAALIILHVEND